MTNLPISVYEFFSGCGGGAAGLRTAGMQLRWAVDSDPDAAATHRLNFPEAEVVEQDIRHVPTDSLAKFGAADESTIRLFTCTAPCQAFSALNRTGGRDDWRKGLVRDFGRFVAHYRPELVLVENVPSVQQVRPTGQLDLTFADVTPLRPRLETNFARLHALLQRLGYAVDYGVVESMAYGVAQRRRRFLMMASRLGEVRLPQPTHGPGTANERYVTTWDAIGHLPAIEAGETHPEIPDHRAASIGELNLRRLRATPPGQTRKCWPEELRLACHNRLRARRGEEGHADTYGRLDPHSPANGVTTRCTSLSNGRFGHPYQDRAITPREAACLQGFGMDFRFAGRFNSTAEQIGNAVPVRLAAAVGEEFIRHVEVYRRLHSLGARRAVRARTGASNLTHYFSIRNARRQRSRPSVEAPDVRRPRITSAPAASTEVAG